MVVDVLGFKHDVLGCQCLYYEVVYGQKGLGRKTIRTQSVLIAYHYKHEIRVLMYESKAAYSIFNKIQLLKAVNLFVSRFLYNSSVSVNKENPGLFHFVFQPIHTPEEDEEYMLKPMNCPHHCEVFARKPRSYKDLPLRIAEFGTVFRYEKSGELHGLTRVRTFTQDDAHIFVRPEQVKQEFENIIDIILKVFSIFGFENYEAQISLHDPKDTEKYIGSKEIWAESENAIREACREKGLEVHEEVGEAAFYGPKLDFMVKDAIGRRWQLGTIQVDYNLPQRFKLEYTAEDNSKQTPVMIHRAPFGSMERFTAVLIEHTAGHFPLWLTPDQVAVLPISEKYNEYAKEVQKFLDKQGVRAVVDDRNEKIGRKIRDNELKRVPYMVVVGEKEAAEGLVSMRKQGGGEQATMTKEEFAKRINDEVAEQLKAAEE